MTHSKILGALACLALIAACGGKPAPEPESTAEPAAEAPAAEAQAPAGDVAAAAPAGAPGSSDGETVEAATAATSQVAKAVAASTPPLPSTAPLKWVEGQHYTALPAAQPVSVEPGQVEVIEIFWYGCGHCYSLEARLEAWERSKPAWITLRRLPVIWNEVTREDARLFFVIEALDKVGTLHAEVFRELHVNRRPLTMIAGNRVDTAATEQAMRKFLVDRGVSEADFAKHYRSFSMENRLRQAEGLARRYLADHTPMVIVQGKYQTDVTMAGGPDQLFQVINDLAAREVAGR